MTEKGLYLSSIYSPKIILEMCRTRDNIGNCKGLGFDSLPRHLVSSPRHQIEKRGFYNPAFLFNLQRNYLKIKAVTVFYFSASC